MNDATRCRFYFPAWNKAVKAMSASGYHGPPEAEAVNRIADELSVKAHRQTTADDLRYACHIVAIGKDKSSKELNAAETDRVVCLFQMLADPDDLRARMEWENPEEAMRRRVLWSLKHWPDAYLGQISKSRWGTYQWRSLPLAHLRQLNMTVRSRARAKQTEVAA